MFQIICLEYNQGTTSRAGMWLKRSILCVGTPIVAISSEVGSLRLTTEFFGWFGSLFGELVSSGKYR